MDAKEVFTTYTSEIHHMGNYDSIFIEVWSTSFNPGKGGLLFGPVAFRAYMADKMYSRVLLIKKDSSSRELGHLSPKGRLAWFYMWFPSGNPSMKKLKQRPTQKRVMQDYEHKFSEPAMRKRRELAWRQMPKDEVHTGRSLE